jgi:hypothetical protein
VPDNDADDGRVNHALEFDMESIEHPVELPENSPGHGLVNHAEDFDKWTALIKIAKSFSKKNITILDPTASASASTAQTKAK